MAAVADNLGRSHWLATVAGPSNSGTPQPFMTAARVTWRTRAMAKRRRRVAKERDIDRELNHHVTASTFEWT
jgi:hypothetical protein